MTFLTGFVREWAERHYPGRSFTVGRNPCDPHWTVYEDRSDRSVIIPATLIRNIKLSPHGAAREIIILLDNAFDLRTEAEKLPWQLWSL